jgi:hypothetical protein
MMDMEEGILLISIGDEIIVISASP